MPAASSASTGLYFADDVLRLVGADRAEQWRSSVRTFSCVVCRTDGDTSKEAASAVAEAAGQQITLRVAHQSCAPSHVLTVPAETATPIGLVDLVPRAIAVPSLDGTRPMLLLAYEEQIFIDGSRTDPLSDLLVRQGLHRLVALGRSAPRSPAWRAVRGPGDALEVDRDGEPLLTQGQMFAPAQWLQLVAAAGEVTLLVGRLEREAIYAPTPPHRAYAHALRSGAMVAGRVRAHLR